MAPLPIYFHLFQFYVLTKFEIFPYDSGKVMRLASEYGCG